MSKRQKVVKVEMRETTEEVVLKSKRCDYKRGGYKIDEKIFRRTIVVPAALLDCGHWRMEQSSGTVVSAATHLVCFECERTK